MYEGAFYTVPPDATPTPNPELDELMRQELESEGEG